jgi:Dyp-type peroxidase family
MSGAAMSGADTPIAFGEVQANILLPYARANCGRVMCVSFDAANPGDASALLPARAWLDAVRKLVTYHDAVRDAQGRSTEQGKGPWFNVGLTAAGLAALGFDPFTRKYLPAAFQQGMERRRQQLGDGTPGLDDGEAPVHAIVFCYAYDGAVEAQARKVGAAAHTWQPLDADEIKDLEYTVDRALEVHLQRLPQVPGVRHLPELDHDVYRLSSGDVVGLEYFGFRDGIAQPRIHGVPADHPAPTDTAPGAVLLGYPSPKQLDREADTPDGETREQVALDHLVHGSFLVLRQLVQDVEGFRKHLGDKVGALGGISASELAEYMMGRRRDGRPIAADGGPTLDAFTYDKDKDGRGCPFHAHTRRANPRDERAHARRLMRRGMPTSAYRRKGGELGLLFMAYNADIEGQFEFVQRQWMNAGAESHGLNADRDPIAGDAAKLRGAPTDGGSFSFVSSTTKRAHTVTGLHSHVRAGWGEYVLVPSRSTLAELSVEPSSPISEYERRVASVDDPVIRRDILGRWLDDADTSRRIFAEVRARGGAVRLGRDKVVLVGTTELVAAVAHDDGQVYSVSRQGEAMRQTTGAFYLGMDPYTDEYKLDSQASAAVIPGWKRATELWSAPAAERPAIQAAQEKELAEVRAAVGDLCKAFAFLSLTKAAADEHTPDRPRRGEIVLTEFTAFVLAGLTPRLFGVPQPSARATIAMNVPPSGYTFFAFPDASYAEFADQASKAIRLYLAELFKDRARRKTGGMFPQDYGQVGGQGPANPHVADGQTIDVAWQAKLDETLTKIEQMFAAQNRPCTIEDRVRLMAGVISGMLITSFKVFTDGITEHARRFDVGAPIVTDPKTAARLPFRMMRQNERSMPNVIYRRVRAQSQLGGVTLEPDDVVLACQGSAMVGNDEEWFYGDRTPAPGERPRSPHFCPGYLAADAIIETMSMALLLALPDLRRESADGDPLVLSYDWAKLNAAVQASAHR